MKQRFWPLLLFIFVTLPTISLAGTIPDNLQTHPSPLGNQNDFNLNFQLNRIFNNVLNIVYLILGALVLMQIIYTGIQYISSGSSPEKAKKARQTLILLIAGVVLLVSSYALLALILGAAQNAATRAG